MKFTLALSLVVAAVFGCKTKPSVWRGIPANRACGEWDGRQTTCIADGQTYMCVDGDLNGCERNVQCAPVSMYQDDLPGRK